MAQVIVGSAEDPLHRLLGADRVPDAVQHHRIVRLRHIDSQAHAPADKGQGVLLRIVQPFRQVLEIHDVAGLVGIVEIGLADHALAHRLGDGGQPLDPLRVPGHDNGSHADVPEEQRRGGGISLIMPLIVGLELAGLLDAFLGQPGGLSQERGAGAGNNAAVFIGYADSLWHDLHQLEHDILGLGYRQIYTHNRSS